MQMSNGELPELKMKAPNNAVGEMLLSLKALIESFKRTSNFAEEIGKGNFDHPFKPLSGTDVQGHALLTMRNRLKSAAETESQRAWMAEGLAQLNQIMRTSNDDFNFQEFGDDELEFMEIVFELKKKYPNPKMVLVVPMSSFRTTLKKVFKNIKGLNANMVIGPAEIVNDSFDIVVVDESHRLRRRINLGAYFRAFDVVCEKLGLDKHSCNELDWIMKQSESAIYFYDENQSIKPSDVKKENFDKLKASILTKTEYLKSQFRAKGGNDYVNYIDNLLKCKLTNSNIIFDSKEYEFILFDSIEDIVDEIDEELGFPEKDPHGSEIPRK